MAKKDPATAPGKRPKKAKAGKAKKESRFKLLAENYKMSRKLDPKITWWMLGAFLVAGIVMFGVGMLLGNIWWLALILGVMSGSLAALIVMARRGQRAAIKNIEGQPGAAVRVLSLLKRGWRTDEMIAFTKQQDMVHRVVGPPGIVLVGEGNGHRLKALLLSEHRKHARVASETTIHEVVVGNGEGQVPLKKLVKHVTKLPKSLKPAEMTGLLARLKALDANRSRIPLPKGPVPTSMKGMRGAMRGR